MRWLLDLAIALTRAWTAGYTRGLPADVRAERREEIDSDLWHQRRRAELEREPVTGTAVQILVRVVLGIPADLLWRFEAASSTQTTGRTSVNETLGMRIGFLAAIFPLALLVVMGVSFMLGNGDWENSTEHWLWRVAFVAAPAIGGYGLWLCATRPKVGMGLALAGVGGSSVLMPWMAVITVPIGLVIIAFAVFRAGFLPRPSSRQQPA